MDIFHKGWCEAQRSVPSWHQDHLCRIKRSSYLPSHSKSTVPLSVLLAQFDEFVTCEGCVLFSLISAESSSTVKSYNVSSFFPLCERLSQSFSFLFQCVCSLSEQCLPPRLLKLYYRFLMMSKLVWVMQRVNFSASLSCILFRKRVTQAKRTSFFPRLLFTDTTAALPRVQPSWNNRRHMCMTVPSEVYSWVLDSSLEGKLDNFSEGRSLWPAAAKVLASREAPC